MLTLEENAWNFKAIQISSALQIFPIEIDMKTGEIQNRNQNQNPTQRQANKLRILLWNTLVFLGIAHCLYIDSRLIQSTLIEPEKYFRWDHFILHFPFAVNCLFRKNSEECVIISNQLFKEWSDPVQKMIDEEDEEEKQRREKQLKNKSGASGRESGCGKNDSAGTKSQVEVKTAPKTSLISARSLFTWPPQYSLDETLAKTLAFIIPLTTFLVTIIFALDPSRPQLLYSSLPPEYQNFCSFFTLLVVEAIFIQVPLSFYAFSVLCQLLFFAKCQLEFKRLDLQLKNLKEKFQSRPFKNRNTGREIWILRQILKGLREMVLFIELFNRCFPFCIFVVKLNCFTCILFYFFTIRHFQDFPFLAAYTGYVGLCLTLIYGTLYLKAFSIPEKMERLKNEVLLSVHKTAASTSQNANERFRTEMTREIEGIRNVGIKVGSFHQMERESTPKFVDFVFQNIVNLLVTFPR